MLVVLSQRIDIKSEYADELFTTYHYPSRYRNQLHVGDTYVYYQGNRHNREQRYYFGTGVVAEILAADEENYYAKLSNCKRFTKKVPIYLPDGGYIEQLAYEEVRKCVNPPWQSSIRPLSEQAFNYILSHACATEDIINTSSVDELEEQLKKSIRSFYVERDEAAILDIGKTAVAISKALNISDNSQPTTIETQIENHQLSPASSNAVEELISYCARMKMSYSYKPVLVMALFELHDKDWSLSISRAAEYFKEFYWQRRVHNLPIERKKCIYQNLSVTLEQITTNLIANPVKALVASGFFEYSSDRNLFSLSYDLKKKMNKKKSVEVLHICRKNLEKYYSR